MPRSWLLVVLASGCRGLLGIDDPRVIDASSPPPAIDAPLDACATCGAVSCLAINQVAPSASSGVYTIDPDGSGAPFEVYCDMTTLSGGWTLVGRERPGLAASEAGPLRYLGVDSMNASALAAGNESGIVGTRFAGVYGAVMISWGARYIRFDKPPGFDMFANTRDTSVDIGGFSTNEGTLNSWIGAGGGARLCVASRATSIRPGDTSWAIKARNDSNTACGCSDMNWAGRGAYYGGAPAGDETSCNGWGGGWAGVRDNGVQKGGIAPTEETRIWIR